MEQAAVPFCKVQSLTKLLGLSARKVSGAFGLLQETEFDAQNAFILQLGAPAGLSSADFEVVEEYLDWDNEREGVLRRRSRAVGGKEILLK
jgi:hypothetical protein